MIKYQMCVKCAMTKEWGAFYKHKRGANGLMAQCKVCMRKARMERYYENKEEEHGQTINETTQGT